MKARLQLFVLASFFVASSLSAQTTWTATPSISGSSFATSGNWSSGVPSIADIAVFQPPSDPTVLIDSVVEVTGLEFNNSTEPAYQYPPYRLTKSGVGSLRIGGSGIILQAVSDYGSWITLDASLPVTLSANQTWEVNAGATLLVASPVAVDAGVTLQKTGPGSLILTNGGSSFTTGITVKDGSLFLGSGLGTIGSITLDSTSGTPVLAPLYSGSEVLEVSNNISWVGSGTPAATFTSKPGPANKNLFDPDDYHLRLSGTLSAPAGASTIHVTGGKPVWLTGTLAGTSGDTITFDSGATPDRNFGAFVFANIAATAPNVVAANAAVIFGTTALPMTIAATTGGNAKGYVGIGVITSVSGLTTPTLGDLMNVINEANFAGTLGFDSDTGVPYTFTANLDVSSFTNTAFSIGSMTGAILQGTITPPDDGTNAYYRFGGGTGGLVVKSSLADTAKPASVTVGSPQGRDPQIVVFQGNNTYTGTVTGGANLEVTRGLAILDSSGAMPAAAKFSLGQAGYVSYTENAGFATFASFVGKLDTAHYTATSILGLDSGSAIANWISTGEDDVGYFQRSVSDAIDLSALSPIYLGTTTDVRLTGTITAPLGGGLLLTAMDESRLTIDSVLASGNVGSVTVGFPTGNTESLEFGSGVVWLTNHNSYTGGTTLLSGTLVVQASDSLGTGTLTVGNSAETERPVLGMSSPGDLTLSNTIDLGGTLRLGTQGYPSDEGFKYDPRVLELAGQITGAGGLDIYGRVKLSNTNSYFGTTNVHTGGITFATAASLPVSTMLRADYDGFVAIGFDPGANLQTDFIDRFVKDNTFGTIGLDGGTFAGSINLSDFNGSVRLGSPGSATVSGTITPADNTAYRFGGGGGKLTVSSVLADDLGNRSVEVRSPFYAPLTLRLTATNTYSGSTSAENSAVIFAAGARPASSQLKLGPGGYIGTEEVNQTGNQAMADQTTAVTAYLGQFASYTADSGSAVAVIGFDSDTGSAREITGDINLTGRGDVALGSATSVKFTGTITPANSSVYAFAAYKGGRVEVASTLTGAKSVMIGDPNSWQKLDSGFVVLSGSNNYTGGTRLASGTLTVANSLALGTGTLQVGPDASFWPQTVVSLWPEGGSPIELLNQLVIQANAYLMVGTAAQPTNFVLQGASSGSGSLHFVGDTTVEGTSTRTGPTYVDSYVTVTQNSGLGSGSLYLQNAGTVEFTTLAPQIGSLGGSTGTMVKLAAGSTLTITQSSPNLFGGTFTGSGVVWKTGANLLTLTGNNSSFDGGIQIAEGGLRFEHDSAAGSGSFVLGKPAGSVASATFTSSNPQIGALSSEGTGSYSINLAANSTLTVDQTTAGAFSGAFVPPSAQTANLRKTGTGDLTIAGNSTLGGNVTVDAGRLLFAGGYTFGTASVYLGASPASFGTLEIGSGADWINSGELKIGYFANTTGQVTVTGTGSTLNTGTLLLGNGTTASSLTVTDAGQVSVTGAANVYANSSLNIGSGSGAGSFSASSLSLASGGTLNFDHTDTRTFDTPLSGSGAVDKTGTGTLTLAGNSSSFSGSISIGDYGTVIVTNTVGASVNIDTYGQLQIGAGGSAGSVSGSIANAGVLVVDRSDTVNVGGITGAGKLQLIGPGTVVLAGTNTYHGDTQIENGTLTDAAAQSFSANSDVLMFGGALTVDYNETIGLLGDLALEGTSPGTVTIADTKVLTLQPGGALTSSSFSGTITGPGKLALTGSAVQTLNGNSDYAGGTTIGGGATLIAASSSALGSGTVTINSGGTVAVDNVSIANAISLGSGATISGEGEFLSAGGVIIGSGVTLAPGTPGEPAIGTLNFTTLTLNGGGVYQWNVFDSATYDQITIGGARTLNFEEGGSAFTFELVPLSGAGANFTAGQPQSFTLFQAMSEASIVGFANFNYTIDAQLFAPLLGDGSFWLEQSGSTILLNFTPVPEPSTWALLITGLAVVGVGALRQRWRR